MQEERIKKEPQWRGANDFKGRYRPLEIRDESETGRRTPRAPLPPCFSARYSGQGPPPGVAAVLIVGQVVDDSVSPRRVGKSKTRSKVVTRRNDRPPPLFDPLAGIPSPSTSFRLNLTASTLSVTIFTHVNRFHRQLSSIRENFYFVYGVLKFFKLIHIFQVAIFSENYISN